MNRIKRVNWVRGFWIAVRKYVAVIILFAKPHVKRVKTYVIRTYYTVYKYFITAINTVTTKLVQRFPKLKKLQGPAQRRSITYASRALIITLVLMFAFRPGIFALPDLNDTWDFNTPSDYTYDSGIEVTSGVARLKAQNYATDANTSALYHFDESGGALASDATTNANNLTLSGGSFTTGNLNNAVSINGTSDQLSAPDSASLRLGQTQTIEAWTKFGSAFSNNSHDRRQQIVDKGDYQLYYDNETGKLTYELANANASTWSQVGGNDINNSWDANGKLSVNALTKMGTKTYAAIGNTTGDAEVWSWDGTTWTKIGGGPDSINNSWTAQTYEGVYALANDGTHVYAGLGTGTGDAEVWSWDGTTWTKIGGDSLNNGWTNYAEQVWTLDYYSGKLYAGIGSGANDAEVWSWDGTTWTKIGGDSVNSGWTTNYEIVGGITNDGTNLYAGLGTTAGDSEVWRWNGTTWTKIGGDSLNSSWDTTIETVRSLRYFGSTLYAGLGDSAGDAEVWAWNGTTWTKIGGDTVNSSWADTTYEQVTAFGYDGTNLYAGLGTSNGDGEVWRYNGSSWTQIGGDSLNNSWQSAWGDSVNTLLWDGTKLIAGTFDTGGSGWTYSWDGSNWDLTGGNFVNKSWGFYGLSAVQVMQAQGDYLYAGLGNTTAAAVVMRFNGSTWEVVGGQGVNGSWAPNTYEQITSMASYKGRLYVGLGSTASASDNDAEVWSWDGTTWTKVGGDGANGSWAFLASHYGEVDSLAADASYLYAGLGAGANDGEVWRYDGSSWTKIGGDSLNSGWTNYAENVYALAIYNDKLIAGLGRSAGDAEVWQWNGTAWTKFGGDSVNSSWSASYITVESMATYNNAIYVGLGNTTGQAVIWRWDGTTWTQIGGDGVNSSWSAGTYERVRTIASYNGNLYAGLGNSTGDGEVWQWDGATWTKIGGSGINSGWSGTIEEIESFSAYKGKLYVGTGLTANSDATVWAWGDNAFVQSSTSSFDTNWHHVAATYNGSVAKLYVDGSEVGSVNKSITVNTSARPLLVGAGYGGREAGRAQSRFSGSLDEIRLSNINRSSFTTTPYATSAQTISNANSIRTSGVWHWDTLSHTQLPNGGNVTYRLSNDDGTSWLYWDGVAWSTSANTGQANTTAIVTAHFDTFPVTFKGLRWQAIFSGNGSERVALDGVSADSTSDNGLPSSNPTTINAYMSNGGNGFSENAWINSSSPYFTWDAGSDAKSGVYGYCAYIGSDQTADPTTTKGLLGNSPADGGGHCPFVVSGTSLDLATAGIMASPLTSSSSSYYVSLRTIDKAGNVSNNSKQFAFKFDNTPPVNPGFITAPSGFINTKDVELTWQTAGGSAASDTNSGVAGLQYRIGASGTWYGDSHTGIGDSSDLLANDGSYNTIPTPDHNNLTDGINTIYFRTWDNAGNYTTTYTTATLKINTNGTPSEPNNLVASPATNTQNAFAFNWDAPTTFVGDETKITYCYTVNVLPTVSNCVFTAAGSTELTLGAYATQPGANTMYVVARDESNNINYASYSSVNFTANTTAPGIPLNTDIVDVSIKNTSNWRLALTWEQPAVTGAGVSSYRVYRSTDNNTFSQVGTSSSTTYIDANLAQQTYYYRVTACDNTNNCGAHGSVVSELPTGKFTSPAELVGTPKVSGITTRRAVVSWGTDRASDSKIAIGTKSGQYGSSEVGNSNQVAAHEISLDNLSPGTTYYYRVKWTDEDGNTGTSQEQTFTTSPAPVIKEVSASNISLNGATVGFTTKGATKAFVYYGNTDSFGGYKEINTSTAESTYQVRLDGLTDGTKYYFMISAVDAEGSEYRGSIASFQTPQSPRISNLRFQPVVGEPTSTQRVTWDTNVPSTTQVTYSVVNQPPQEQQTSQLTTQHEVILRGLRDDSEYVLVAQSRDGAGNLAVSDRQAFRTALDTRPPKISDITVESSVRGAGSEARGQIVVSWRTDEPATSQVAYTEGSEATTFNSKTAEDNRLTTEHIVIISSLPTSRVFSVQPVSSDGAKNQGLGDIQTVIVGRASDNALTVVFNTLKSLFGF